MQAYIQRLKPKLKIILTLAITLVATLLMYKPLETKATDINLQGVDSTKVVGGGSGKNTSQMENIIFI